MTDRDSALSALAALRAAISLLESGGKNAAPSDKMFAQMLKDYRAAADNFATALAPARVAEVSQLSAVLRVIDSCGGAKMPGESDDHHAGYSAALEACDREMKRAWPRLASPTPTPLPQRDNS